MLYRIFIFTLVLNIGLAEKKVSFNQHIRPILSDKCYFCHGPDAEDIKGDLQLHTFENATSDRNGSGPALVPGKTGKSLLWKRITTKNEDEIMPPLERHMALTKVEVDLIKRWIEQGAEYEGLWSLEPLPLQVKIPGETLKGARNAIDGFVHQKLKEESILPSREANSNILLRRLYLSLTGLNPTLAEIQSYKIDSDKPGAYERLVDELLGTLGFAERLSVDWMDLARYADSYGFQQDRDREVWPWRDWVIDAFMANMPYDEFIKQQLAGDIMANSDDRTKLATAFNRLHMQKNEGGSTPEEFRVEYVADRAQTASTAFLGLTMECCRCHDHKYDPISMKDYYRTYALFNNIDEAGLYAFFKQSVPSPTMPVFKNNEKAELKKRNDELKMALGEFEKIKISEKKAFALWKKDWNQKIEINGEIANFKFDRIDKGKVQNELSLNKPGKLNLNYSKAVEGKIGKAVLLDGDSDINLGDIGPFQRHLDFSFSLWMKSTIEHKRAVVLHRSQAWHDAASRGYELLIIDGCLEFALVHFSPGNEIRIRSKDKLTIEEWQHVTVTYDGSSTAGGIGVFVNGERVDSFVVKDHLTKEIHYQPPGVVKPKVVEVAENKGKKSINKKKKKPTVIAIKIGARMRDSGFKNSPVDELSFFDRQLTALEIKKNFKKAAVVPNDNELFEYYLANHSIKCKESYANLQTKRKDRNEFFDGLLHMMIMEDMPERRKTYVLSRGLYSAPDLKQEVQPGPPKKVFPFGEEYSRDRLGFANWLIHPEHPLTARVAVNRFWQMIFGNGIVTTTNDFGSQGGLPSHPELLDYLSRYFIDSGWDIRALTKLIVMSQTFRQDSNMSKALYEKDPGNQLLARGPAYFITAEMLRDNLLYAAGLLSDKQGGRSVKPQNISHGKYRRSLYSHWKRNAPSPEMLIFGAPRRQVCNVKREKTSTPLQPLVLMNSPQVIESSRSLASKILKENEDDTRRMENLFQTLTSRKVLPSELSLLNDLLADQVKYFKASPDVAKKLSEVGNARVKDADLEELSAWTIISNAIMNLDSFYMLR